MSQAFQTSNARNKPQFLCYCGNPAVLRKSHTDSNPGRLFFNCAVGQYNGSCSVFEWFKENTQGTSPSMCNLKGLVKFEVLQELRESDENRELLTLLLLEAEGRRDHLKRLLKETEQERNGKLSKVYASIVKLWQLNFGGKPSKL
ncbi:hypothetical protein BC332_08122 [Capsicum chinense]|nr:hypothetical protein BC332_08122 [Capsicum chinense]